jgi:magnesium transporter
MNMNPRAAIANSSERLLQVNRLREANDSQANALLADMHPAEIADVLEALPQDERLHFWEFVGVDKKGEVLIETHDEARAELIAATSAKVLQAAVQPLQPDELADLMEQLPDKVVAGVLAEMDAQRKQRLETVRQFPDDTAGGLMDVDALVVRADATLGAVLRYLRGIRRRDGGLPEHIDTLMVVDRIGRYEGLLTLSDVVSVKPDKKVSAVMIRDIEPVKAMTSSTKVARLFEDRDLVSIAVVDEDDYLIGRVTVDDIVDVIREEGERSIMSTAGLDEDTDMFAPIAKSVRRRMVWLVVNLINGFIAAWVIGQFDATIEQMVALAVLMPVVASMGGVAGSQTLTLVTRGLALEQVGYANLMQLLLRELSVGLFNGVLLALIVSGVAGVWFGNWVLAGVFAIAVIINLVNGALVGTLVPMALLRVGIDPALAGGVVLTAATDVIGFFSFLGLATLVLL